MHVNAHDIMKGIEFWLKDALSTAQQDNFTNVLEEACNEGKTRILEDLLAELAESESKFKFPWTLVRRGYEFQKIERPDIDEVY